MENRYTEDKAIESRSTINFVTPSEWAMKNLTWLQQYGHFTCDSHYSVLNRHSMQSLLCIITLDGVGAVRTALGTRMARAGDVVLIDCRELHEYWAPEYWEFDWLHIHGGPVYEIAHMIQDISGNVVTGGGNLYSAQSLRSIAEGSAIRLSRLQEANVSRQLNDFLVDLLNHVTA